MKYGGAHELIRIARSAVTVIGAIGGALHQPLLRESRLAADAVQVRLVYNWLLSATRDTSVKLRK